MVVPCPLALFGIRWPGLATVLVSVFAFAIAIRLWSQVYLWWPRLVKLCGANGAHPGRFACYGRGERRWPPSLCLSMLKHSEQKTGRSSLGWKGTSVIWPHCVQVAGCIWRGVRPPKLAKGP